MTQEAKKDRMASPLRVEAKEVRERKSLSREGALGPEGLQGALEGLASLRGPVRFELVWTLEREEFAVRGKASGEWEIGCSRCLRPGRLAYSARVEGRFPGAQGTLDAAEEVRQALVLAVPMRVTCRPECRGLCARCGANRNDGPCPCEGG